MMARRAPLVRKVFKQVSIAPVVEEYGWSLELLVADIDEFGTFSGEVLRRCAPDDTVRRKALVDRAPRHAAAYRVHGDLPRVATSVEWTPLSNLTVTSQD